MWTSLSRSYYKIKTILICFNQFQCEPVSFCMKKGKKKGNKKHIGWKYGHLVASRVFLAQWGLGGPWKWNDWTGIKMNCRSFCYGVSMSRGEGRVGWADGKVCSQRFVAQHGVPRNVVVHKWSECFMFEGIPFSWRSVLLSGSSIHMQVPTYSYCEGYGRF